MAGHHLLIYPVSKFLTFVWVQRTMSAWEVGSWEISKVISSYAAASWLASDACAHVWDLEDSEALQFLVFDSDFFVRGSKRDPFSSSRSLTFLSATSARCVASCSLRLRASACRQPICSTKNGFSRSGVCSKASSTPTPCTDPNQSLNIVGLFCLVRSNWKHRILGLEKVSITVFRRGIRFQHRNTREACICCSKYAGLICRPGKAESPNLYPGSQGSTSSQHCFEIPDR